MDKNSLDYFDLLKLRLSLVIVRYKFTFLNTADEFHSKLEQVFKKNYSKQDIKMCLMQLEEIVLEEQEESIIHISEDFKLEENESKKNT